MKQLIKARLKEWTLLLLISLSQVMVFAQDSTVNASQSTTKTTTTHATTQTDIWYMQPWAWIAGGVLLILILAALFRGNSGKASSTDRVTVTKTVRRESESD